MGGELIGLVPFRNLECKKPGCVFDVSEVLQKYIEGKYNEDYIFSCGTCGTLIQLRDFFYDETLAQII